MKLTEAEARALYDEIMRGKPLEPPPGLWPKIERRIRQRDAVEAARTRIHGEQERA